MKGSWKLLVAGVCSLALCLLQGLPALACGGLVAPNGSVRLARAATLVAWHQGIEYYLTSFSYQGDASNLGWIVPLPAVPLTVQEGGAWTLQRLARETAPPLRVEDQSINFARSAQVLQQVEIEALNISVIRGSGSAVLDWAAHNGFILDGETQAHLLTYAQASPIFMAAKFDTGRARARHEVRGDGTPILITMPMPHIWIPLEVLAIDGQPVNADLYLLTDQPVYTSDLAYHLGQSSVGTQVDGAPGLTLQFQEPVNTSLYHDLSTDRNMRWVWPQSWLTYLRLDAPAAQVTYDLSVSRNDVLQTLPFGTPPLGSASSSPALPGWLPALPMGSPQILLSTLPPLLLAGALLWLYQHRRQQRKRAARRAMAATAPSGAVSASEARPTPAR